MKIQSINSYNTYNRSNQTIKGQINNNATTPNICFAGKKPKLPKAAGGFLEKLARWWEKPFIGMERNSKFGNFYKRVTKSWTVDGKATLLNDVAKTGEVHAKNAILNHGNNVSGLLETEENITFIGGHLTPEGRLKAERFISFHPESIIDGHVSSLDSIWVKNGCKIGPNAQFETPKVWLGDQHVLFIGKHNERILPLRNPNAFKEVRQVGLINKEKDTPYAWYIRDESGNFVLNAGKSFTGKPSSLKITYG